VASSSYLIKRFIISAGLILSMGPLLHLTAQEQDLFTLSDTSYYKPGQDDWNLVESVLKNDYASVLMLLKRGADPNAKAEGGMTALMYAAELGDTMLVKLLVLNGADTEISYVENTTPLIVAILNGHFDVAHYLLRKGADPDHQDDYKGSPLLYAAAMNSYSIADLLLFYGASDSIEDKEGNDAMMTSVFFGNLETVDVLLQNGLYPDSRDKKGNTPLMIAAQQGHRDMIPLLLEYGAGLENVNNQNYTPLAHAIRFHQDSAAMVLMDSGANVHHLISKGKNIYDLAVQQNRKEIVKLLKAKGAVPIPKPDFSEIDVSWGNSYSGKEYMMQTRVAWVDRKFGFFGETGFDFRPFPLKVQVEENDTLIYQYREQRMTWTHGAGKYFKLFRDELGLEYGAYAGLYGLLSFPRYRGISDNPPVAYTLLPSAGFFLRGDIAGLKAGVERYSFGTLHEGPWKMNITLYFRISYKGTTNGYKDIQY